MAEVVVEVDITVLVEDVLVGAVESRGRQVAPRALVSLKSSARAPLETPNFVPAVEEMVELALYISKSPTVAPFAITTVEFTSAGTGVPEALGTFCVIVKLSGAVEVLRT